MCFLWVFRVQGLALMVSFFFRFRAYIFLGFRVLRLGFFKNFIWLLCGFFRADRIQDFLRVFFHKVQGLEFEVQYLGFQFWSQEFLSVRIQVKGLIYVLSDQGFCFFFLVGLRFTNFYYLRVKCYGFLRISNGFYGLFQDLKDFGFPKILYLGISVSI